MSGPGAAPSDTVQPQKTGEQRNQPSRKTPTAATSLPAITAFSCDTIFDLTPSDLAQVSAGLASRGSGWGGGGEGAGGLGCRLRLQKSRKENEHFRFNCSPFGDSSPARSEKDSRQTDIAGVLSPFFCPLLSGLFTAGSSWMQRAVWVIDYSPPALKTVILSLDGTMREGCSPLGVVCTTLSTPFYTCSQCRGTCSRFQVTLLLDKCKQCTRSNLSRSSEASRQKCAFL